MATTDSTFDVIDANTVTPTTSSLSAYSAHGLTSSNIISITRSSSNVGAAVTISFSITTSTEIEKNGYIKVTMLKD